MKKIVLIIAYVLNVSIGICGGIIVTQGDCCGGGSQNNQAQLNVRALNMLSTIGDTTVIDGGDADRNTYKNLGNYSYRLQRTGDNIRTFGIRDTITGVTTYDGMYYYGNNKMLINGFADMADTAILLAAIGGASYNTILVDSSQLNILYSNYINENEIDMNYAGILQLSSKDYALDEETHVKTSSSDYDVQINKPITTGNYDAYTDIHMTPSFLELSYDRADNPIIAGDYAYIRIGSYIGNTDIEMHTTGGIYNLNTAGTHQFTSLLSTTATFNGDIEATAFNVISDKNLKENIKEAKSVGLLDIPIYTYNYNGVVGKDTIYYYDTIGYKNVKKDIAQKDVFGNKSKKTITYKEPIINKVIKDVVEIKISQPKQYGLMAQDIAKIAPEAISDNGDYQSVDYAQIVAILIMEVKELKNEIEILKQKK